MAETGTSSNDWIGVLFVAVAILAAAGLILRDRIRKRWRPIVVHEHSIGMLLRDGVRIRNLEPGRHRINGYRERVLIVGLRPRMLEVRGHEVLGSDGLAVKVSVDVKFQVVDPVQMLAAAEQDPDFHAPHMAGASAFELLRVRAAVAVRDAVARRDLAQLLDQREQVGLEVGEAVASAAGELGLAVDDVLLRDLALPGPVKKLMAAKVQAQIEGQAALERARAEHATMRSLANTARLIADHPDLARLRIIQEMSAATNPTFVVGVDGAIPAVRT